MLEFEIQSNLYHAGYKEDGTAFDAEQYFIIATDEHGNRWRHDTDFIGCCITTDDEGFDRFEDLRVSAQLGANRLLDRINAAGGLLDWDHWDVTYPVYGSPAYCIDPVDLDEIEYY